MQAFRYALRVVVAHPAYLIVYLGFLSCMGLFVTVGVASGGSEASYEPVRASVAVVDRDGGALAAGLEEFLDEGCDLVAVRDDPQALQDAVARGEASCVVIVPAGYGDAFIAAARSGEEPPVLELAYSFASLEGTLGSTEVDQYLSLVRAAAVLRPDADVASVVASALEAGEERVAVETVLPEGGTAVGSSLVFYLKWCAYTLTAAVSVSVSLLMGAFNRTDLRRRNLVAPVTALALGLRKAAAGLVVALGSALVVAGVGWLAFGGSVAALAPEGVGLMALAVASLALVPLAVGFLLGQLGASEMVSNAAGNILGMVLSFLGGAWVPLSLMPDAVVTVARFTPVFWYTEALDLCARMADPAAQAGAVLADLGLVALFALAIFSAGLVAGRLRLQSAAAGGNAAAAPPPA